MIIIGSRALKIRNPAAVLTAPVDYDFVCTQHEFERWCERYFPGSGHLISSPEPGKFIVKSDPNFEFEIISPGSSSELLADLVNADADTLRTSLGDVPSVDLLFTIKASHRFKKNSPFFWKTLSTYHLLKRLGAKVRPEYVEFLKLREKETYNYKHPKLNQSKDRFFDADQVTYVYDHDTIHEAVKLYDVPAYKLFQRDNEEVACDREKFNALPHKDQLASVIEESCVLAIERSLVPLPGAMTPEQAWRFALSKVCTSIASGWWRDFAYENALNVLNAYPRDYWQKFLSAVDDGRVKKL